MLNKKFQKKSKLVLLLTSFLILIVILSGSYLQTSGNQIPSYALPEILLVDLELEDSIIKYDIDNPIEMEGLFDDIYAAQLDYFNLVGLTVSVVKDGSLFLTKGYGYRNYSSMLPVDPLTTLFRLGSISKTFTAISILQLMEDGLIDLDEDVNTYLTAFQIADTYAEPITIRHLLTHSAGFEETVELSFFEVASEMPDLEETLTTGAPMRVNPPGEVVSYSNYGFTLLGYIVEELTGMPFAQYVQIEIFTPFEMNHTTFEQQLPSNLESDMAVGYWEEREVGYFEYLSINPAAGLTSSAGDMVNFMLGMLNNATYDGNQILENTTVEIMQSAQFITHPDLQNMCFGLYEMSMNDEYIIGHGGDTVFFHSRMALFPEHDFGLFISYNNREGITAKLDFFITFMNYYFPYQNNNIIPMEDYTKGLSDFAGFYLSSRRHYRDAPEIPMEMWMRYFGLEFVSTGEYLKIVGVPIEFVQTAPNYFVERTGQYDYTIVFFKDEKGRVTHFHSDLVGPTSTFEKLHFVYRNFETFNAIIIAFAVIFLVSLTYWGTKGLYSFITNKKSFRNVDTIAKWWVLGIPATFIPFALYLNTKSETVIFLEKEVPEIFGNMFILPLFTLIFVIGLVILTFISWMNFMGIKIKPKPEKESGEKTAKDESQETTDTERTVIKKTMRIVLEKLAKYQPIIKRVHYSILAIFGISLIFILGFWDLLRIA